MRRRPTPSRRPSIALFLAVVLGGAGLDAQPLRPGVLVGRVLAASGGSVDRAVVRVSQGATIHLAEGEDDGDYRVDGLTAGRWQVSVRREGFTPLIVEIEMPAAGLRKDLTLVERTEELDASLIAAGWKGVRGVVTDSRGNETLAGASLRLMGSDAVASTDSTGRFSLPLPADRDFILRVARMGFETRLLTGRTPATGYLAVEVALDTTDAEDADYWVWRDLERRLKYATPRAALMTRTEVRETRAVSLGSAIEASRSVAGRGLVVTTGACLFVDGLPRPGATVDAIRADDVEFVEVYPEGTDLTRTLASRWPTNAVCGHGNLAARPTDPRRAAQFVAVWLRTP